MSLFKAVAPIILKPSSKHTATVIFLHGLGDTGVGILEGLRYFGFRPMKHVKYVFPTAPLIPVTANFHERMPAWFDLIQEDRLVEDTKDVTNNAKIIDEMVEEEEKLGISSKRIVIGGFSQGGALSMFWALSRSKEIGGVIGLSSWVPCASWFPNQFKGNSSTFSFIGHGAVDSLVEMSWAKPTHDLFSRLLPNCTRKDYKGMDHEISFKEINDVQHFISSRLPEIVEK